ncbi:MULTISPECIES: hypothetical protein [Nocardia]|uniref:hypothetical protein n=1 Tax=Nocardia TaxID=1817 RepID=UPI0033BB4015
MKFDRTRDARAHEHRFEDTIATQYANIVRKQQRRIRIPDRAIESYQNSIHHATSVGGVSGQCLCHGRFCQTFCAAAPRGPL